MSETSISNGVHVALEPVNPTHSNTFAIGDASQNGDEEFDSPYDFKEPISLVAEMYGDERYEYYPLSEHIVIAPGVCGGRPTFKYTRLEVGAILALLSIGETAEEIVQDYSRSNISVEAIHEAIGLAREAFIQVTKQLPLIQSRI